MTTEEETTEPPWYRRHPVWAFLLVLVVIVVVASLATGGEPDSAPAADTQADAPEPEPTGDPCEVGSDAYSPQACVASNRAQATEAPAAEPEPEPEPEPPPLPEPEGEVGGKCDLLLFVDDEMNSEFAASVDVTNTGNIGIVVKVTAEFDQLGRDDYVLKDRVRVKPGQDKTAHMSEIIDNTTVSRHQDGGYECRVEGEIVDTFGAVEE